MSEEQAAEAVSEPIDAPVNDEPEMAVDEARAAVDRAFEAMESEDAPEPTDDSGKEPEAEAKPDKESTDDRERNPDGTFKAKEDVQKTEEPPAEDVKAEEKKEDVSHFAEPPSRFSADAKTAWKDAPEPVRAEIHRAVKELEAGIDKYREQVSEFEPLQEYNRMASQHGTTIKEALDRYTNLEKMLAGENPMAAIKDVMFYANVSPQDFAAEILRESGAHRDMTPEQMAQLQNAGQQDSIIRDLRNEIAALKQEITGVSTTVQDQRTAEVEKQVAAFAADKPRFEELSSDIKFFLESGRTNDLAEAYSLAERLNPAPAAASESAPAEPPPPDAQPKKGALSVTGAPSSGSNPANRKPPSSAEEAVNRSFAALGIG